MAEKRKAGKSRSRGRRGIGYIVMWYDGAVYHIRAVGRGGGTVRHASARTKTRALEIIRKWARHYHAPAVVEKAGHQTGRSNLSRDAKRRALPPGKRVSRTGHVYYEYRRNRTDKNPKRKL